MKCACTRVIESVINGNLCVLSVIKWVCESVKVSERIPVVVTCGHARRVSWIPVCCEDLPLPDLHFDSFVEED